jgi:predicted acetyltransferase
MKNRPAGSSTLTYKELFLLDIRFVRPDEVGQLARNVVASFPSKTPQDLLDNMPSEVVNPQEGRYLGCFDDDGTLLGSILMMSFEFNVRGVMMPMGAPAYVSTNFLHKKEKIAFTLLRVMMGYFAETSTPISCLHPFNPAFYGQMGYGYCNENIMYMPRPCYIRSFDGKSGLSYATDADRDEILAFYRSYAKRTNGATVHPYMDPYRIFGRPYVIVCRRNGKITGYMTYEFVDVPRYTDMYHDLYVHEMIYDDLDTLRQFMTFFASQTDQIERVRIFSTDEYLHMMFTNPDSGENFAHDGCIHEIGRRTMGSMVRILDVTGYFKWQTHCCEPTSRVFNLALDVTDPLIERNNGTYYLGITGDAVTMRDTAKPDVRMSVDIGTLSSIVMGAYPVAEAAALGRITVSDPSYIPDIQRAIGWNKKPVNVCYF